MTHRTRSSRTIVCALVLLLAVGCTSSSGAQECPRGTLPAYSHNDYERVHPLTDALHYGYRGVEADVFLVDGVVRVGHDRRSARLGGTLEALYLAPLQALVSRCGRLTADSVPFLLAIEIKERSFATLDSVLALLQRRPFLHRELRHALDGRPAIEVVMVGWRPASPVASSIELAAQQRVVGWHHRISRRDTSALALPDPQVKLVSLDYGKTIGRWWVTAGGRRDWLATLRAVKSAAPGRLLRVHNLTPNAASYRALLRAGVDLIGTKELERTSRLLTELGNR